MQESKNSIKHAALEITNLCNLECTHCYASSSPREKLTRFMTEDDWLSVISDLKKLGCNSIQFIGGEPTAHPSLPRLIEYAHKQGINKIQVYTNGISISDNLMNVFVNNNVSLAFSVYSNSSIKHDAVTTVYGSHKRTEKNIARAVEKQLNVAVGIIAMDSEDNLEIESTISYIEGLGVMRSEIGVDRVRAFGRGNKTSNSNDKYSELCGRCWSERIAINDRGDISPCVMSGFVKLGHISSGLVNVIESKYMKEFHLNKPNNLNDEGDFLDSSCRPGTNCRCPKTLEIIEQSF